MNRLGAEKVIYHADRLLDIKKKGIHILYIWL